MQATVSELPDVERHNHNTRSSIDKAIVLRSFDYPTQTLNGFDYNKAVKQYSSSNFIKSSFIDTKNELAFETYEYNSTFLDKSFREINNISMLRNSLNKEIKRIQNKITIDAINLKKAFYKSITSLIIFPMENCAVDINSDNTIKISMLFSNDRLLMLTIPLSQPSNMDEVLYSFFINRKLIASDVSNFHAFAKSFKEYIC